VSHTARPTTIKPAAPLSASVGIAKPTGIKAISAATATACDQGSTPNTAHLKSACPTRNSAVPPRVSVIEASVPVSPGCATVSSSGRSSWQRTRSSSRRPRRARGDRPLGVLHRRHVRRSQKGGRASERPSGAKVVRSWRFQTALLFLSPSTQRVLHRTRSPLSKRLSGKRPSEGEARAAGTSPPPGPFGWGWATPATCPWSRAKSRSSRSTRCR
jgi:hypothetical protein